MGTIYTRNIFIKSELFTADRQRSIICTLKEQQGKFNIEELLRNDSKGSLTGRLVIPSKTPSWLVPGTILYGTVNDTPLTATVEPNVQSRIKGIDKILGDKITLSYSISTEFN